MKPLIRRELVGTPSDGSRFRILFASDLHLGLPWTRRTSGDLIDAADAERPDIVLLGGDLVDNRRGLDAIEALRSARSRAIGRLRRSRATTMSRAGVA